MQELLGKMGRNTKDLKSAEEYIMAERFRSEKKVYQNILQRKCQNKLKMHLAMSRIAIYLYVHLILQNIDVRMLLGLIVKLHESHRLSVIVFLLGYRPLSVKARCPRNKLSNLGWVIYLGTMSMSIKACRLCNGLLMQTFEAEDSAA